MSETTELEKNTKPWHWPGEWFRDEKFWREVTARGLSGLIVVFLAYWAAILLGILQTPTGVFVGGHVLMIMLFVFAFVAALAQLLGKDTRAKIHKLAEGGSRTLGALTGSPSQKGKRLLLVLGYAGAALIVFYVGSLAWFAFRLSMTAIMRGKPLPDNAFEVPIWPDN